MRDETGEDHEWWLLDTQLVDGKWQYTVRNLSMPGPGEGTKVLVPAGYLPIKGSVHPFYPPPRRRRP